MCEDYDRVSIDIAKRVTRKYSTSFSLGIYMLHRSLHDAIYSIYGFDLEIIDHHQIEFSMHFTFLWAELWSLLESFCRTLWPYLYQVF